MAVGASGTCAERPASGASVFDIDQAVDLRRVGRAARYGAPLLQLVHQHGHGPAYLALRRVALIFPCGHEACASPSLIPQGAGWAGRWQRPLTGEYAKQPTRSSGASSRNASS